MKTHALIVIDVQNDFLPGGALPVADGDEVIPIINRLMDDFEIIVATQDWHPADHASFFTSHEGKASFDEIQLDGLNQTLWPPHCVQDTLGAEFSNELRIDRFTRVFRKGTDRKIDSYSGFYDNGHHMSTGMGIGCGNRESPD